MTDVAVADVAVADVAVADIAMTDVEGQRPDRLFFVVLLMTTRRRFAGRRAGSGERWSSQSVAALSGVAKPLKLTS